MATTTPRMTLAALQQTPEFKRLSVKAKLFVQTYVASYESFGIPDAVLATQAAYDTAGENARKMSYAVLKNKKVSACLKVWVDFGKSKRELFIEDLERQMKAAPEGTAKHDRLVQLYGEVSFGAKIRKPSKKTTKRRKS
jgi:hypothetical protein